MLIAFTTALLLRQEAASFSTVGPMSSLMPEGKAAASVSGGLSFAVTLSDGGKTISSGAFDLKVRGTDGTIHVSLDSLALSGGVLSGKASVSDVGRTPLEGLRVDLAGVVESYKAKDAQGKEIVLARGQAASIPSPLHFGDLKPGEDAGPLSLAVSGIRFLPETTAVTVRCVVTGLAYTGMVEAKGVRYGGEIATDAKGRIYLGDTVANGVQRMNADGSEVTLAAKLPDQCQHVAVDLKSGEIAAICGNHGKVFRFTPGGEDKDALDESVGFEGYGGTIRYDAKGSLWTLLDGVSRFGSDRKSNLRIPKAGDYDLDSSTRFDVGADGTVFALTSGSILRVSPDGKTAKRIVSGPGVKPGQIENASTVRLTPQGTFLVLEGQGDEPKFALRISEFDREGRLVRVFGRGARAAMPSSDEVNEGQPLGASDLMVGVDGRLYVNATKAGSDDAQVLTYVRF